ncbi:MAG: sterol desaturase family protein [Gemmataceae bacterium]
MLLGFSLPHLIGASPKFAITVATLAALWGWETWRPFFARDSGRLRHAGRNLTVAAVNAVVLAVVFGAVFNATAEWADGRGLGLLRVLNLGEGARLVASLILLDGWTYLWHRANHAVPLLWRFHRMHHSDPRMDVTTATQFHLGEHVGSAALRVALIPLAGFGVWHLVCYDTAVIVVTMLHHANVSLGQFDRRLRWLIVTPDMHKVHHSTWRPETDSNFATVLSVWDRVAGTFQLRPNVKTLEFGLPDFAHPKWQTVWGMFCTPVVSRLPEPAERPNDASR